jgi:hypothetical protein
MTQHFTGFPSRITTITIMLKKSPTTSWPPLFKKSGKYKKILLLKKGTVTK